MSARLPKACGEPGCPGLAYKGPYCERCEGKRGYKGGKRLSASKRGYGRRWQKLRRRKLELDPWCEICQEREATIVHHLDPIAAGNPVVCRIERLESCCLSCHSKGEGWGAQMR